MPSSSPMFSIAIELGHSNQTNSSDVMQLWHDINTMINSPKGILATKGALGRAEGAELGHSERKKSDGDLMFMLLGMNGSSSGKTSSSLVMMQSEPSIVMAHALPIV